MKNKVLYHNVTKARDWQARTKAGKGEFRISAEAALAKIRPKNIKPAKWDKWVKKVCG